MWRLTGDATYAKVFAETWRFVDERQTDMAHGEWYETVTPDGAGPATRRTGGRLAITTVAHCSSAFDC